MKRIVTVPEAIAIRKNTAKEKKVVVVGGCFDILHRGHIAFLQAAKKQGDVLFVLLESDAFVKAKKGENRPINTQGVRATILSNLRFVDYIVLLDKILQDNDYDDLVLWLKPAIIATTKGDPSKKHKERQAKLLGKAQVVFVIDRLPQQSTTQLVKNV